VRNPNVDENMKNMMRNEGAQLKEVSFNGNLPHTARPKERRTK
jgi:hypothetical protein